MTARTSTRQRILETATELIWRLGYNAVSVDAICEAASVRKGSFYHAFASKERLLATAISHRWAIDRREIEGFYALGGELIDQFRNHLEWFGLTQRRLKARFGFVPGYFNMAMDINVPESALVLARKYRLEHGAILQEAIRRLLEETDPAAPRSRWLASVVGHLIGGAMLDARLTNSLATFDTLPESVLALLGLAPAPAIGVEPAPPARIVALAASNDAA